MIGWNHWGVTWLTAWFRSDLNQYWPRCTFICISQYWLRKWYGAIRQGTIIWANVDPDPCCHMASQCVDIFVSKYSNTHTRIINWKLSSAIWWPFCFSLNANLYNENTAISLEEMTLKMTCAKWWPFLFWPKFEFHQNTKSSHFCPDK